MATKTFNSKKYGKLTVTHSRGGLGHVFTTDKAITQKEAGIIQQHFNYHPAGYGLYSFTGTSWTCSNSCD